MTDELCARDGCGAPKAWHGTSGTLSELLKWRDASHQYPAMLVSGGDGVCQGNHCACHGYVPPEPPKPKRKAYVVEIDPARQYIKVRDAYSFDPPINIIPIPLADYLAAHPEARWPAYDDLPEAERAAFERVAAKLSAPAPLCICGGEVDDHDPVTGRCNHVAKRAIPYAVGEARSIRIETLACMCRKFEAQP